MSREVHVLLETSQGNLSTVMQGFNTLYTKYFNSQHNTTGHLFQGRYKALLVEAPQYLAEASAFVHLQPLRLGLKEKPWRYQWSSCAAYVESEESGPLIDSDAVLSSFGRQRLKQSVRYLKFIQDRMKMPGYELPVVGGVAVGSEEFLAKVLPKGAVEVAAPLGAGPEARKILAEVAASHGIDQEKLLGRLQWREISSVRRQAVHRIWKEARVGVTELSRLFNRTPSAISQMIRAMEPPLVR
ncbi:MAG: hypothetical protein HY077_03290 [Elusimicrobia bacterium]|nr:hypothetical protein [Elusimicrobiota bacterium]